MITTKIKTSLFVILLLAFFMQAPYLQQQSAQATTSPLSESLSEPADDEGGDGDGLTATLNSESFRRGDTIVISGTVEEREGGSTVYARVFDPDSVELDIEGIHVNTDGTFRHGFIAGEDSLNDGTSDPMTESGTYTITLEYFPPSGGTETTEVTFEYDAEATAVGEDDSVTAAGGEPTTTFQNLTEGFRIQVPSGWVADDQNIVDYIRESFIATNGYDVLGLICSQENALPKIGGLYDCTSSVEGVGIYAYPNLHTRPEFAPIINQNQNITMNDIIAFDVEELRNRLTNSGYDSRISIEGQTETTVNFVNATTNQIVQTLPAVEVVYGFPATFGNEIYVKYDLLVLADNGNTSYSVESYSDEIIELDDEMPTPVRQAFDSFELLTPSSKPNVTSSSSPQEQSQQQLVQSAGGLTARLNANNFTTGDTITVNGTVAERDPSSYVRIMLIDPLGKSVLLAQPRVTADNFFTNSSVAGAPVGFLGDYQMEVSGNYLLQVEQGTDVVEFTFSYNASAPASEATTSTAPPTSQVTTGANTTPQESMYIEQARTALQNNDTQGALMHLDLALNALETNQSTSQVRMHLEEARTALQNNDTQGALMHLDLALNALGGASGAEMNMTNTTGGTEGGNNGAGILEGIFGGVS
jgi:hypothetical protein